MSAVHVMPVRDYIRHEATAECACGPTPEPVDRPDGSTGWVYVHHSLDGRERGGEGVRPTRTAAWAVIAVAIVSGYLGLIAFAREWSLVAGLARACFLLAFVTLMALILRLTR